ncbi:plasmid pRiA4b ORF-3 family protein [Chloroflexota bacterium]
MFWREQRLKRTDERKRTLRALEVSEDGPGTVLRDFQMLLSFVQEQQLPASKVYRLPPRKVLPEINARLAQPIELGLKQPQLKSYPHIHGLYLLLRANGLGCIRGTSAKPVLAIDEAVYDAWSSLNPTERYFTLLETWLVRGYPEIVGERGNRVRFIGDYFLDCADLVYAAQGDGLPVADSDRAEWYYRYSPGLYGVALLELFGFLTVQHGRPQEGLAWQIEHVSSTPLGTAVFALLAEGPFGDLRKVRELEDAPPESFGVLQPTFQPYVPAWRTNLSLPVWAFREGVHVFKVSLWRGLWRRIAVPGRLTMDALATAIINAFEFTHDHLYRFSYRNSFGVETHITHPYLEEEPFTSEVLIGQVPLREGQSMIYLYDFGDQWEFDVTLERVDQADAAAQAPVILDRRGEGPDQYPSWDE